MTNQNDAKQNTPAKANPVKQVVGVGRIELPPRGSIRLNSVGTARLELATSRSQTVHSTN